MKLLLLFLTSFSCHGQVVLQNAVLQNAVVGQSGGAAHNPASVGTMYFDWFADNVSGSDNAEIDVWQDGGTNDKDGYSANTADPGYAQH